MEYTDDDYGSALNAPGVDDFVQVEYQEDRYDIFLARDNLLTGVLLFGSSRRAKVPLLSAPREREWSESKEPHVRNQPETDDVTRSSELRHFLAQPKPSQSSSCS